MKKLIRSYLRRHPSLKKVVKVARGQQEITLDYPGRAEPRYGYGKPPHPRLYEIIDQMRGRYVENLNGFLRFKSQLLEIPIEPGSRNEPSWDNPWITGLDIVALYSFIGARNPGRYMEVGSGWSTKVARRAIRDLRLGTKITSIDPQPRAEIDAVCDELVRQPLEDVDLTLLDRLADGDVLFVDGSHRCFTSSDATVAFLDVLPRLKSGVLVGIHDIFLPYDYPPAWADRLYSEQYLLAAYLLAEGPLFEIELPSAFISYDRDLAGILDPVWADPKVAGVQRFGGSFWFTMKDGARDRGDGAGSPQDHR